MVRKDGGWSRRGRQFFRGRPLAGGEAHAQDFFFFRDRWDGKEQCTMSGSAWSDQWEGGVLKKTAVEMGGGR